LNELSWNFTKKIKKNFMNKNKKNLTKLSKFLKLSNAKKEHPLKTKVKSIVTVTLLCNRSSRPLTIGIKRTHL
jgi:hypothetical protein